jgi:LysR family transcriptional regulator, glycine cleavage system transcriptional activator
MAQPLPPLNSLRFFEAAARLGNYRLVAEELHVTASAVSHSILTLEAWFGAKMFERASRGLRLTPLGRDLLPTVTRTLCLISDATDKIAGARSNGRLSLGSEPAFANSWLVPRLTQFAARHPAVLISIGTLGTPQAQPTDGIDLEIRYSEKPPSGMCRTRLLRDTLVPVGAPHLVDGDHERLLHRLPLLRLVDRPDDWDHWLDGAGIRREDGSGDMKFGSVQLALEAARQGLGLAMGRCLLVEDDLVSGRLAALSLPRIAALSSYWLVGAGPAYERRESRAFRRWLVEQLRAVGSGDAAAPAPAPQREFEGHCE